MTERILEAYSKRNPATGSDYLGSCTVVLGDGTMKVDFVNGRAQVPESLAEALLKHPHVIIYGYGDTPLAPSQAPAVQLTPEEELERLRLRQVELEEQLAARQLPPAADPSAPPEVEVADAEQPPAPDGDQEQSEVDPAVQAAIEHLRAEGEDVPDIEPATEPAPPANPGFDSHTTDGQPRCQAAKADGTQCSNAATSGQACQLGKHQEQLAA